MKSNICFHYFSLMQQIDRRSQRWSQSSCGCEMGGTKVQCLDEYIDDSWLFWQQCQDLAWSYMACQVVNIIQDSIAKNKDFFWPQSRHKYYEASWKLRKRTQITALHFFFVQNHIFIGYGYLMSEVVFLTSWNLK